MMGTNTVRNATDLRNTPKKNDWEKIRGRTLRYERDPKKGKMRKYWK